MISRGNQRGVGWLVAILSILFPPLSGGALVLILALGLSFAVASVEAWWERRLLEVLGEGRWPWVVRARTPVDAARASVRSEACVDGQLARSGC